jgi:hypothetical protein
MPLTADGKVCRLPAAGLTSQEEKVAWFQANRSEVEAIASRKFDAAMVEVSGDYRVRVNTIDLNTNRSG